MNKFKVGDKVRRVTPSHCGNEYGKVGEIYTVSEARNHGIILKELGPECASSCFFELVSKSYESPVKTISTKVLKEGWIGNLYVWKEFPSCVHLRISGENYNVDQLDTVISQLTDIRDYLKEESDE